MNTKALISLRNLTQDHPVTGGAQAAANVLLGLYNGTRFPFDLTDLRLLDQANLRDAPQNAAECGGFDLTNLFSVDQEIAVDMVTVFSLIARVNKYPDSLGFGKDFEAIVRAWRPELVAA